MIDDVAMAFMFLLILASSILNLSTTFKREKKAVLKIEGNVSKKDLKKLAEEIVNLLSEE